MRILVLALNPSIDVEWKVREVRWEEKNSIESEIRWPGGKGVNVARWLRFLGCKTNLLIPLGGRNGEELSLGLRSENLRFDPVNIQEETRANVIVTAKGRQLRFNPLGPTLSPKEKAGLISVFDEKCGAADMVVLSGSLPRGLAPNFYSQLIRRASRLGKRVMADCDGIAFAEAVRARPFLVKPNEHELSEWYGKPLGSLKELVSAARRLAEVTTGWVLVSRGARGAFLLNARSSEVVFASPPRVSVRNTVGAGDALLAGACAAVATGKEAEDWLRSGVGAGAAAVEVEGGGLPVVATLKKVSKRVAISTRTRR